MKMLTALKNLFEKHLERYDLEDDVSVIAYVIAVFSVVMGLVFGPLFALGDIYRDTIDGEQFLPAVIARWLYMLDTYNAFVVVAGLGGMIAVEVSHLSKRWWVGLLAFVVFVSISSTLAEKLAGVNRSVEIEWMRMKEDDERAYQKAYEEGFDYDY